MTNQQKESTSAKLKQTRASIHSVENSLGTGAPLQPNVSSISLSTPLNSADSSAAGSYVDSSQLTRPTQLFDRAVPRD